MPPWSAAPTRVIDLVSEEIVVATPAGKDPDVICHLYGVRPPLALIQSKVHDVIRVRGIRVVSASIVQTPPAWRLIGIPRVPRAARQTPAPSFANQARSSDTDRRRSLHPNRDDRVP